MSIRILRLELEEDLCRDLEEAAAHLGLGTIEEALRVAAVEWTARRKEEFADSDPGQRYFVNEALDELISKKR
jgi:hypothetical protein